LKQYLQAYVHYGQSNWAELLPFAEFHANSTVTAATGISPFFATRGYHPRTGLEPAGPHPSNWKAARDSRAADALIERIAQLKSFLTWNIRWAQSKMEDQANCHRLPAPQFIVCDQVMLDARNMRTCQKSHGLAPRHIGPFTILSDYGDGKSYKLDFTSHKDLSKVYPVFHPWLLHPVDGCPLPGQRQDPQGPVKVDNKGNLYEVEDILDAKVDGCRVDPHTRKKGMLKYLVKWLGYDKPDWVWYPDVTGAAELVARYHKRHPEVAMPDAFKYPERHDEQLAYLWING
jgi:hypothetical protein